jgi:D-glycero-alpha-D-manno-heptose 1-phosphate guanylyltransferase
MKALVLAGGLGTRLRDRVPDPPKVMAPVAGRPFLEYVLDGLQAGGMRQVILSVGYKSAEIIGHFGNRYRDTAIRYAIESEPLGTGGAIVHALAGEPDEPVLVCNGDTLLDINYRELLRWYAATPAKLAMVLRTLPEVARYGSVLASGAWVVGFEEKGKTGPGLVNAGMYVLEPGIFGELGFSGKFSFEVDFLQPHCATLQPSAYVSEGFFIDIGMPADFDRAQSELPRTAQSRR